MNTRIDLSNITEIKENLIKSEDIFNLLANLYYVCSTEFTSIYNLMRNNDNYRKKFLYFFHNYNQEFLEICDDIFVADFRKITDILSKVRTSGKNIFLLNIWAYLRSIDLITYSDSIYLNTMKDIRCKVSDCFGIKEFLLLFKPKNLIFNTIKNKFPEGKLKIGFDIGQRIEDHLQNLIFYEELLSRKIDIKSIDPLVNQLLLEKSENLSFAVAPISFDFGYSFKSFKSLHGVPYVFDRIENWKEISTVIGAVLKKCVKEDVNVIVFPELTINKELRNYISNWLYDNNKKKIIIMVVAGSYHKIKYKNKYENSSIVYRFDGKKLWEQHKMNQFQLDEEDIKRLISSKLKGLQNFKKMFHRSDKKGWERIEISNKLVIYDTVIGRMAITICLDYFVREKEKLLIEPNVNLIFVPAMSATLKKMDVANFDLGTFGLASIFCANSCWVITGGEKNKFNRDNSSYIYIPQRNGLQRLNCVIDSNCINCNFKVFRISKNLYDDNLYP